MNLERGTGNAERKRQYLPQRTRGKGTGENKKQEALCLCSEAACLPRLAVDVTMTNVARKEPSRGLTTKGTRDTKNGI